MNPNMLEQLRKASFDAAMMTDERRTLGITEEQIRQAIWSGRDATEIVLNLRQLREAASGQQRSGPRPSYRTVERGEGKALS